MKIEKGAGVGETDQQSAIELKAEKKNDLEEVIGVEEIVHIIDMNLGMNVNLIDIGV